MNAHILVIEHETKLANFIKLELEFMNYRVSLCHSGLTGLNLAREYSPDLILVDFALRDLSGVDICRKLRQSGSQWERTPIILLIPDDTICDRATCLDAGADDYLLKTFSVDQLLGRIRANLGSAEAEDLDLIKFADLKLNRHTRQVYRGQQLIDLTAKEFDLLEYLVCNAQQVLTREQILETVWGYDFNGDSNIIEVYIRYLRLKLEARQEKRLIQTVRGVGYVLQEK
jgi:two-component system OmpR family response regulator